MTLGLHLGLAMTLGGCAGGSADPGASVQAATQAPTDSPITSNGQSGQGADEALPGTDQDSSSGNSQGPVGNDPKFKPCTKGFIANDGKCLDINECTDGTDTCDSNASCTNTEGSYTCTCAEGFDDVSAAGEICINIDECDLGLDDCASDEMCQDTAGAFNCVCGPGLLMTADGCVDLNECLAGGACASEASCTNTHGGYLCTCPAGYEGDAFSSCDDVDECVTLPDACKAGQGCVNTPGSYNCTCSVGFVVDPISKECVDENECETHPSICGVGASCSNTVGGYDCGCAPGYEDLDATGSLNCADIDECTLDADACGENASCLNVEGAYACNCDAGFARTPLGCEPAGRVDAGSDHSCAIENGELHCWGDNSHGEIGLGSTGGTFASPQAVKSSWKDWKAIATGKNRSCGIRGSARNLYCWGDGFTSSPTTASTMSNWVQVSVGSNHQCATQNNGDLYCWGADNFGQLGNGSFKTQTQIAPDKITDAGQDWRQVSAGDKRTCAITNTGTLWCWGATEHGALGLGTTFGTILNQPWKVGDTNTWVSVSVGNEHACGVHMDGSLWCWGNQANGRLGNGLSSGDAKVPVRVGTESTWQNVSAGRLHTCGTRGSSLPFVFCWGSDSLGQLGNGTGGSSTTPGHILFLAAQELAVGEDHTCSVHSNGSDLHCWGRNDVNQCSSSYQQGAYPPRQHQLVT
jgi:alpha-tubulin suppressor-like RCC1 family protein